MLVNNFSKYFNNSRQPLDQKAEEGIPGLYKMFSIFNISDLKTPQNKSINLANHGKRTCMLKLHFSCSEIQHLSKSNHQGPYNPSPTLNNSTADSSFIL